MNKVKDDLYNLTGKDMLSLVMFVLFKIREIPDLAVLSQLAYLIDETSFMRIVKYFGGQSITFPTYEEVQKVFKVLLIYEEVELSKSKSFSDAVAELGEDEKENVLLLYKEVKDALKDYTFV